MSAPEQTQMAGALIDQRLNDYSLCEPLALGGVTAVYRAIQQISGAEVAIKTLALARAGVPEVEERFRLETRRLAAFRHRHIAPLLDFGETGDLLYFVMPLAPGSLRDRLEAEGPLPPVEATRLAIQVASALGAAHARGVVHRDIKPENILLTAEGDALVTDFGIARDLASLQGDDATWTLSSIGLPVGTPEYMPPEQLRGEPADQRVDVYALGAVLYEMLTGEAPHEGPTPWAVAAQALMNEITPPTAYAPDVWPELERLVLSALAHNPSTRPDDMLAFEEGLRDALGVREARWEPYADAYGDDEPAADSRGWPDPIEGSDEERAAPVNADDSATPIVQAFQSASMHATPETWTAMAVMLSRIATHCAEVAVCSWRLTTPTYEARKTALRRIARWSHPSSQNRGSMLRYR